MKFEKGYMIVVDSYENDGEHQSTRILTGLSENELLFYHDICDIMGSSFNDRNTYGNMFYPDDQNEEMFYDAMKVIFNHYGRDFDYDDVHDVLDLLLGTSDNYFTRACKKFVIYEVPETIEFFEFDIKKIKGNGK